MEPLALYMSLDGFITGPDDGMEQPLGANGFRLHDWLVSGGVAPGSHRPTGGANGQVSDQLMDAGAVLTGRRTFDLARVWGGGDHHDGVPVRADPPAPDRPTSRSSTALQVPDVTPPALPRPIDLSAAPANR